jgi:hypothetical protein
MPVRRWGWSPREVERAIEVVRKTGLAITAVTISTKGDITVATGATGASPNTTNNEIEQWVDKHHARKTAS